MQMCVLQNSQTFKLYRASWRIGAHFWDPEGARNLKLRHWQEPDGVAWVEGRQNDQASKAKPEMKQGKGLGRVWGGVWGRWLGEPLPRKIWKIQTWNSTIWCNQNQMSNSDLEGVSVWDDYFPNLEFLDWKFRIWKVIIINIKSHFSALHFFLSFFFIFFIFFPFFILLGTLWIPGY